MLVEFAKQHPGGFTSADVKRTFGWDANKASTQMARLMTSGKIISFDDRKAGGSPNCLKVYYPAGVPAPQEPLEEKSETLITETLKPEETETAQPSAYERLKEALGIGSAPAPEITFGMRGAL